MEEITTAAGLRRLRPDWNGVEAAGEPINPFLSWEWQWSWWETFGGSRELRCLVVSDPEQVVGIVPLQCLASGPGRLSFGGGADLSDHLGFLFRPARAPEVASAALEQLRTSAVPGQATTLDLHYLEDGSPALAALRQAAEQRGLGQDLSQEEVSPQVRLGADFEEYLTTRLNKKDRHELRRKLRRLETELPGWSLVTQEDLGLEAALNAFFPILRASGPHKVEFLTPAVEAFIRRACQGLEQRGWLRLQFIEAGGKLLAATLGFTVSDTWRLYNSGYQPEAAALSPGLLCVAEGIRVAIEEGCHTADFLRGSEAYKYHLGAVDTPLWRLRLSVTGGPESGR
ncbi:MAG: GNAT family N-acetyltransferase [Candidatus Dormibacteria bacterium]